MATFKLTLKRSDDFSDWQQFCYSAMLLLRSRFELIDEADLCGCTLKEYFKNISEYKDKGEKKLRDFTISLTGSDWKSNVDKVGNLVLVGDKYDKVSDDFCSNCGSPNYSYFGDGQMYCSQCDTRTDIDMSDMYGFDLFNELGNILKP